MNGFQRLTRIEILRRNDLLSHVNFKQFDFYPNTDKVKIVKYLYNFIENNLKEANVFIYTHDDNIIALLVLRILDWDTAHFGFKCANIDAILIDERIANSLAMTALDCLLMNLKRLAIEEQIKFISINIDSWDYLISGALQRHEFRYILTWIDGIYKNSEKISTTNNDIEIKEMNERELDYYASLAKDSYFEGGRFFLDKLFDSNAVRQMYSKLIQSCYYNHDIMLSCRINNKPAGLFICKKIYTYNYFNNLRVAPLRFLIISPEFRHKKIGLDLFNGTIDYLSGKCDIITTGLEVHNLPSLNLHSKLKFKFNYTHNVFHWWSIDYASRLAGQG